MPFHLGHPTSGVHDVRSFDRFAVPYDLLMPRADRAPIDAGFAYARRPVERVVEVGGGSGRAGRELDAEVTVVDPAPGMLRRARGRGLSTVRGVAECLPVRDASADAVVVVDALHHFDDARAAVAEAARVLRPGGVLVVREFDPGTLRGRLLAAAERAVGFDSTFLGPDALAAAMDDAGLRPALPGRGFAYTAVGLWPEPGGT